MTQVRGVTRTETPPPSAGRSVITSHSKTEREAVGGGRRGGELFQRGMQESGQSMKKFSK